MEPLQTFTCLIDNVSVRLYGMHPKSAFEIRIVQQIDEDNSRLLYVWGENILREIGEVRKAIEKMISDPELSYVRLYIDQNEPDYEIILVRKQNGFTIERGYDADPENVIQLVKLDRLDRVFESAEKFLLRPNQCECRSCCC